MSRKTVQRLSPRVLDAGGGVMVELKPCPFCGGEIEERGGQCNYGKHIMTLDLKCKGCETTFKFKTKWVTNPYNAVVEAWNRRC